MQIHLDPVGGWSGDMFVAALLDAFPALLEEIEAAIEALGLGPGANCRLVAHRDGALTGRRFVVAAEHRTAEMHQHLARDTNGSHSHGHTHDPVGTHAHTTSDDTGHRSWSDIRHLIENSSLSKAVRDHAVGIFVLLARAEAQVHGVSEAEVRFHEVGAVDSIVDIVAASLLIARLDATLWTSAPLPLGSGRVRTAHGVLPVPAPATALLLEGLATIDDGVPGERVTPTGAAVARYLLYGASQSVPQPRRLTVTGTGFGSRLLPDLPNCLRVLAFDELGKPAASFFGDAVSHRELGVIGFEVDDQSAEDLTHGLDHIRALPGIHDVVQSVVFGKKGRMATHVQVLVAPDMIEAAIAACFEETTTIGLRFHGVQGAVLTRAFDQVEIDGHSLNVKTVRRPSGDLTGKTEAADVASQRGHAARVALRKAGEAAALAKATSGGKGQNVREPKA